MAPEGRLRAVNSNPPPKPSSGADLRRVRARSIVGDVVAEMVDVEAAFRCRLGCGRAKRDLECLSGRFHFPTER